MLETLLTILSWDLPSPEIALEDDGDICLDYILRTCSVSISPSGKIAWAILSCNRQGTDIDELKSILLG